MKIDLSILCLSLLSQTHLEDTLNHDIKDWLTPNYSKVYQMITWYYFRYGKMVSHPILKKEVEEKHGKESNYNVIASILDQLQAFSLPESATPNYLVDELKKQYRKRVITEAAAQVVSDLKNDDVEEAYNKITDLAFKNQDTKYHDFIEQGNAVTEALEDWDEFDKLDDNSQETGVMCGIRSIDERIYGLKPGELGILSGRPGIGKSALLMNFGYFPFFYHNKNVLYISLEMRKSQVKRRMHARGTLIDYNQIKTKTLDTKMKNQYRDWLTNLSTKSGIFYILDIPFKVDAGFLESHIVRLGRGFPIDLIIVDYLGNMNSRNTYGSRWESQGEACIELRELARKYNVPIWSATQLSRSSTESEDLDTSHIAYSDMISQTADYIIGIYEQSDSVTTDTIMMTMMKSRDSDKMKNFKVTFERSKMLIANLANQETTIDWN